MTVEVDGESLTIEDVVQVIRHGIEARLAESALPKIHASREIVEKAIEAGRTVYGVNTGFAVFIMI